MLDLLFSRQSKNCEGFARRDFLRVGALGMGSLTLADLLRSKASAREAVPAAGSQALPRAESGRR